MYRHREENVIIVEYKIDKENEIKKNIEITKSKILWNHLIFVLKVLNNAIFIVCICISEYMYTCNFK